ncbi:MAG: hypothetical protein QOH09_1666 [Pseudonocardiales bacterium]|jgi:hypothetical protein|nr:hypothetical protein [Pseudonocardiales bacterium]
MSRENVHSVALAERPLIGMSGRDLDSNRSQSQAGRPNGVHVVYAGDQQPTAGSYRARQFCANPTPPGTRRHSKPPRMTADLH